MKSSYILIISSKTDGELKFAPAIATDAEIKAMAGAALDDGSSVIGAILKSDMQAMIAEIERFEITQLEQSVAPI